MGGRHGGRLLAALGLVLALVLGTAGSAEARSGAFAPVDRPGPRLSVSASKLARSLDCTANVATSGREPTLLVPGTTLTPQVEFSWNYERAFAAQHRPYCTVTLPNHAMSDIQVSAEYVVYAIRTMHRRSHRRVQILGHSQGGMIPRWALRFWPDTRRLVDDVVGLAPSNHGTQDVEFACSSRTGGCPPSFWQQGDRANFIRALNSRQETFRGISYTDVYTRFDEVVTPNADDRGSSSLHGGGGAIENVALQDICPADPAEHNATGTSDAVAYALALDALDHRGPADPARVSRVVCLQPFQPGVNPATVAADYARLVATEVQQASTYPRVPSEPALKCYVFAACSARASAPRRGTARRPARPRPRFTG